MGEPEIELGFGFDLASTTVPSLGELAGRALEHAADEQTAVAELERLMAENGLRLPPTMGLRDQLERLIGRYARRRVLEELPTQKESVTWLELHVPRGASVSMDAHMGRDATRNIELQLLGSGGGARQTSTISTKLESAQRTRCVDFRLDVEVAPVVYEVSGRRSLELNVLRSLGIRPVPRAYCRTCGVGPEDLKDDSYDVEDYIDLSDDDAPMVFTRAVTVAADANVKVGVEVPTLKVAGGVEVRAGHEASLTLVYSLPQGSRYVPYRRDDPAGPLVQTWQWTVTSGSRP